MKSLAAQQAYNKAHNKAIGGMYSGIEGLDDYWQPQRGKPHIIYGLPHSGKTEFAIEILINLTQTKGITVFLFTPETGSKEDIANFLIEKHIGKTPYQKNRDGSRNLYAAGDDEIKAGYEWLETYFHISDKEEYPNPTEITLKDIYSMAEMEGSFDAILIDTFTHIHDEHDEPVHKFVNRLYSEMHRYDAEHMTMTWMVLHCGKTQTTYLSDGTPYVRPPHPTEAMGGQNWYRLADSWLQVYINKAESEFYEYETWLMVQKMRDRHCGKVGVVRVGWTPERGGRYYEYINDKQYFGNEYYYEKQSRESVSTVNGIQPDAREAWEESDSPY